MMSTAEKTRLSQQSGRIQPPSGAGSGLSWLDIVAKSPSAQALKDSMRARYPFMSKGLPERLAIMGAGAEGRRLAEICHRQGIEVAGIYDNDAGKRGVLIGKCRVVPSDAIGLLDRAVPVIIASHRVLGGTLMLRAMGFQVAPFALLQILSPDIFEPHMFYDGFVDDIYDNLPQYQELAQKLQDEASVKVLDRILGYRLTLDAALLADVIDWDLYGFSGLVEFHDNEVYVDGGAYDGDSVRMFINNVHGKYDRVLAFEPDPQTFQRLRKNLASLPRVEPLNFGLHSAKAELRFNNDGSRGAIITDDGECKINVVALDDILAGKRVTFIKMNIEGAELSALRGGAESIRHWHPRLAISAYHRPSDLWAVPFAFREIDPDYRLYLRQHDGGVIETVAYGVPKQ